MTRSGDNHDDTTCWTVIRDAASGDRASRDAFARRYEPVIRAYLAARWHRQSYAQQLDDAVQDVFVECWRSNGALDRLDPGRASGFRAFLFGVTRNVALRFESKAARSKERSPGIDGSDPEDRVGEPFSRVFDRAWAKGIMRDAAIHMARHAADRGSEAMRRVELLRLRFQENLPIRDIADLWGAEPARLHREYAKARQEFRKSVLAILGFYAPGHEGSEAECNELLGFLRESN